MMEIVARYKAWSRDLAQRGLLTGGEKLTDDGGRHLRLRGGRPIARRADRIGGAKVSKLAFAWG